MLVTIFLLVILLGSNRGDGLSTSLIDMSKHCIQAASEAYDLLVKKAPDEETAGAVTAHLESLIEDGKYLKKSAEGYLEDFMSQEENFQKSLQQLQGDKKALENEIEKSKQDMIGKEKTYSSKEAILRDNQQQLQQAQRDLTNADNEYQRARKKAKKKKKGLFGKVKKFLGLTKDAENKAKRARHNLDRKRAELNSAEGAFSAAKQSLSEVQNKIKQIETKIQGIQLQVDQKHREIGSVKSSIVLLRKSTSIWEEFVEAAGSAEKRTKLLKSVVDHATKTEEYEILRKDGTVTKATSFIEAWAIIAANLKIDK